MFMPQPLGVQIHRVPGVGPVASPIGWYKGYYSQKALHNALKFGHAGLQGVGIGAAVGAGNFLTRNYRQKPLVGLQVAKHAPNPRRQSKAKKIPKNKILRKGMVKYRNSKSKSKTARRKSRKLPPLVQPRSKVIRMRYVTTGTLTGTTGQIGTAMVKANSLNDPTGTISTALPLGLDQWAALYGKYIVLGSKLTIRFGSTSNTGPVVVGCHLDNNNTALTSVNHYRELPMTKQKTLTSQKDYGVVTMKYAGKRFWKLSNIKDDSEQEATFSTTPGDPTDIAYYHIFVQDFVGGHSASTDIQVEEEFIVFLTDPVTLAQSSV